MSHTSPSPGLALVVEDDALVRQSSSMLFEEQGYEVVGVASAEAALKLLHGRGEEVTVLFADVQLAGLLDGVALAREASVVCPHTKVIVTSGALGGDDANLPANVTFILKPWRAEDVLAAAAEGEASRGRSAVGRVAAPGPRAAWQRAHRRSTWADLLNPPNTRQRRAPRSTAAVA